MLTASLSYGAVAFDLIHSRPQRRLATRSQKIRSELGYFEHDEVDVVVRADRTNTADPYAAVAPGDVVRLTADVGKFSHGAGGTVTDVWQAGANEEGEMGPCCSELDAAPITVRLDRTRVELLPKPLLRRVTGVPCVVTSASEAKATLRLLRAASWHPPRHARLLLDADRSTSRRAFQLSDDGARALDDDARGGRALRRLLDEDAPSAGGERAATARAALRRLLHAGTVEYEPQYLLHDHVAGIAAAERPFIRYLAGHDQPPRAAPPDAAALRHFTFAEHFAGIGGFRVALESLEGRCVFASEIAADARAIYASNFGADVLTDVGIHELGHEALPPCDLLTAGFPCQSFTRPTGRFRGSRARGFRDMRGGLFFHLIRLLRAQRREAPAALPRAILLENVPGLLKNDVTREGDGGTVGNDDAKARPRQHPNPSSALPTVLAALSACGYAVSWRLYDSRLVLPQARPRVFIVAIRDDLVGDGGDGFAWPELADEAPTLATALHADDDESIDLEAYRLTAAEWAAIRRAPRLDERLLKRDGVANAIRASYSNVRAGEFSQFVALAPPAAGSADAGACPPWRRFTPREVALQGFPDSFALGEKDEAALQRRGQRGERARGGGDRAGGRRAVAESTT